jgi:dUTP pyrophosphatase
VLPVTLDEGATLPTRAHEHDAGLDLYPLDGLPQPLRLLPGQVRVVPTGVHVAIPPGFVGKIEGRSGLASRGIVPVGGVIDPGYTGDVGVVLANVGLTHWTAEQGRAIAQLVLYRIATPSAMVMGHLPATARGENGFGSTDGNGVFS